MGPLMLGGVEDGIAVALIHHFVGEAVGAVGINMAVRPSLEPVLLGGVTLSTSTKIRQERRVTKLEMKRFRLFCGRLSNLVNLLRAMCCLMT